MLLRVLCIFWVTVLYQMYLLKIFWKIFENVACLLILLILSFMEQKFFNFNEVQLIKYFFYGLCLWYCLSKKHHHALSLLGLLLCCFKKLLQFWVLQLTKSMIHFELILMTSAWSMSRFIFWLEDFQLFQMCLLKRLSLLHCIASAPLLTILMGVYF